MSPSATVYHFPSRTYTSPLATLSSAPSIPSTEPVDATTVTVQTSLGTSLQLTELNVTLAFDGRLRLSTNKSHASNTSPIMSSSPPKKFIVTELASSSTVDVIDPSTPC